MHFQQHSKKNNLNTCINTCAYKHISILLRRHTDIYLCRAKLSTHMIHGQECEKGKMNVRKSNVFEAGHCFMSVGIFCLFV